MAIPAIAPKRHHATWRKRSNHNDPKYRTGASEALHWSVPRPEDEAFALFKFMERNHRTIEEMIALICVSDSEFRDLCLWAQGKPTVAGKINEMMLFREKVLWHFKALIDERGNTCSS